MPATPRPNDEPSAPVGGSKLIHFLEQIEAREAREPDAQRREALHEKLLRVRKLVAKVRNSERVAERAAAQS